MRLMLVLLVATAVARAEVDYGESHRLKIPITGETRKGFLFVPKGVKKGTVLPLVIALPHKSEGSSSQEIGPWQQQAYAKRFAVFSVDIKTSSLENPWHWKDPITMQRDMEAVTEGLTICFKKAKELELVLDRSGVVLTGHSGATFLTLWLGLRRPELFLGICARSAVFFKAALDFSKFEEIKPNYDIPIFLFHGELDAPRARRETRVAKEVLEKAGYKKVEHRVIEKMIHEPKRDVFLTWFYALLKRTAKGRTEAVKVAAELEKLRPSLEAKKRGVYGKLQRLAEREEEAGFPAGARAILATVELKAARGMKEAAALLKNGDIFEAISEYKKIEKEFTGLDIAKKARQYAVNLRKSDRFKAHELLVRAEKLFELDKGEKATLILEKLVKKYPDTPAASKAKLLLK